MNRARNDLHRGAVRSLVAVTATVAACAWAAPANGQLLPPTTTPTRPSGFVDDPLFVNAALDEHTPRAVTGSRSQDGMTGHLMAVTTQGFAYRKFHTRSRSWSSWTHHANSTHVPTDLWHTSMPLVRSSDAWGANVIDGFFGYMDGNIAVLGMPGATDVPLSTDLGRVGAYRSVHAESAITYVEGGVQKYRVFGTDAARARLSRVDWNWTLPSFVENEPPPGSTGLLLGPQGACAVHLGNGLNQRHMVFATAKYPNQGDRVALHYWNGMNWTWLDLGTPFTTFDWNTFQHKSSATIVSPPLVVYRHDNPALPPQINVFIVARTGSGPYTLFEKYCNGTITGSPTQRTESLVWGGWQNYSRPLDTSGNPLLAQYSLTSGCVWKAGTSLRIDLFGHTTAGQLCRFYWDDYGWGWDHLAGAPDGETFRTTSSFVVEDGPGYDRVTVIGRTRAGRIYERYYEVVNGVLSDWTWWDLSVKPVYTSTRF